MLDILTPKGPSQVATINIQLAWSLGPESIDFCRTIRGDHLKRETKKGRNVERWGMAGK
jgi:hypothetical protein